MRWEPLRLVEPEVDRGLALFGTGAVARTFDTPQFRGMTFYEVQARSIINRVPDASRVPFRWTINPYRGCSHQCRYCLWGETAVLMADGRTKPIRDLRVGDQIYGTRVDGRYRRYVTTTVLAHWSTTKPAYRVTLEDGTTLVASADHRFLSDRGWKHVAPSEPPAQRPFLTSNNRLLGLGRPPEPPKQCEEYRRGYLSGMIRGDGHLASYTYERPRRGTCTVHRFRLALKDLEALDRSERFLAEAGVPTQRFVFTPGSAGRARMEAIRTSTAAGVAAVWALVEWPAHPSDQWRKGFLAGIFDAEGSLSHGILRISNTAPRILAALTSALNEFGFSYAIEGHPRDTPVYCIRLRGGLSEQLRFFLLVDPAISRKRAFEGRAVKRRGPMRVVAVQSMGLEVPMYDISTGTGDFIANGVISHNCFARKTHTYLDLDAGVDFDTKVVVKVNAADLLRKELARRSWPGEHIAMGTNVDCYQRAEGRYQLMRGILSALREHANPFSILTKGTLILRDLDLLQQAAAVTEVGTNVSVGFLDKEVWRTVEPGTPAPQARLEVCRTLNDAGIPCGVLMAPILPFLTDAPYQLAATVEAVAASGATHLTPIVLHLRPGAREWFLDWLAEHHPDLVPRYRQLYRSSAYAPKGYQEPVLQRVRELARRQGVGRRTPATALRVPPPAPVAAVIQDVLL